MIAAFDKAFPYTSRDGSAIALLSAFFVIRLAISAVFPVTVDEAYAITVSRVLSLSYFDHPPFAFGLAAFMAWLTGSEASFVIRFPFVISGTLTGWVLYCITKRIYGEQAGHIAAAWYSVTPFFFISAGHFVVPDGPLNLFLVLTFWYLLPVFTDERPMPASRWCLAGLAMAFALMCKYQAVLFGISIFIVLLSNPRLRGVFKTPGPWLALLTAAIGTLPMILWNAQNDWISFKFQTARAENLVLFHWINFLTIQFGQIIYLLPGIWLHMLWKTGSTLLQPSNLPAKGLAFVTLVPVLVFDIIALFTKGGLPHWPMSGFLFAFPVAGNYFASFNGDKLEQYRKRFRAIAVFIPLLSIVVALQTNSAFLTRPFFNSAPSFDLNWHIVGWNALAEDFATRGILASENSYIVPASWIEGGRAGYALGPEMPVAAPLIDPRHFAYMNDYRLIGRTKAYVVYHAEIGQTKIVTESLSQAINKRFIQTGENWTVVQTRWGFPAFEIRVIAVINRP